MKVSFVSHGETLSGVLELPISDVQNQARQCVVFIHGLYQHKNIAFLRQFGERIPKDLGLATFRFDCRGLGESSGTTRFTPHYQNLADLEAALDFLQREHSLECLCIFGYSAGGNVAIMHAAFHPGAVPFIVNASGRFTMSGIHNTLASNESDALSQDGEFVYSFTKRGKPQTIQVTADEVKAFAAIDNGSLCSSIPAFVKVLFCHGLVDDRVPVEDSSRFVGATANSVQFLLEQCGHNYNERDGLHDELYDVWKNWFCKDSNKWRKNSNIILPRL